MLWAVHFLYLLKCNKSRHECKSIKVYKWQVMKNDPTMSIFYVVRMTVQITQWKKSIDWNKTLKKKKILGHGLMGNSLKSHMGILMESKKVILFPTFHTDFSSFSSLKSRSYSIKSRNRFIPKFIRPQIVLR